MEGAGKEIKTGEEREGGQARERLPLSRNAKVLGLQTQVREERPAVSLRDVTQVSAGGAEAAGGQCS